MLLASIPQRANQMYRSYNYNNELLYKYSYVYVLITADRSLIKIGKSKNRLNFLSRVELRCKHFLFNLEESFCFTFEDEKQAYKAEQRILYLLKHRRAYFDKPFIGYTEYLVGAALYDIFKTMFEQNFDGFFDMRKILDELVLKDYDPPIITIHVSFPPPR
jgi:hypothetical protein